MNTRVTIGTQELKLLNQLSALQDNHTTAEQIVKEALMMEMIRVENEYIVLVDQILEDKKHFI